MIHPSRKFVLRNPAKFEGIAFRKSAADIHAALQTKIAKLTKDLADKRALLAKFVPAEQMTEEALFARFYHRGSLQAVEAEEHITAQDPVVFRLADVIADLEHDLEMCERVRRNLSDGTYVLSYADLEALGL